ncbi:hypothetical protein ACWCQK_41055 [Streptomyces sp. NPDC002306]
MTGQDFTDAHGDVVVVCVPESEVAEGGQVGRPWLVRILEASSVKVIEDVVETVPSASSLSNLL